MQKKYQGLFPALITPFNTKGEVDYVAIDKLVEYLINVQKVDGFYVTGSTGEFLTLSLEEKEKILERVAKATKNRVTLIAQVGNVNVHEVIYLGKKAKEFGFDAVSAITPYYYNFSFQEVKSYYEEITANVDLPLFIYYLPQLAGKKIGIKEFGELLSIKNVIGAKYGATDIFLFERLLRTYPEKLFLFAFDEALAPALTLGAKGFIGSTYNINAKGARAIIEAFEKGDKELVKKSVHEYNDFVAKLVDMGVMAGIKAVFEVEGVIHGTTRKPFYQYDRSTLLEKAKEIQKIIKK